LFWDITAGVYDLFAYGLNRKVDMELRKKVCEFITEEDTVLDCACGTGLLTEAVAPLCRKVVASDLSGKMLEKTKQKCSSFHNIEYVQADIRDLKMKDESFDAVIAANVIHLVEDPAAVLNELARVCRKGGKLIVPTYMNRDEKGKNSRFVKMVEKAGADFKRQFTYETYRRFWEENGFKGTEFTLIEGRIPCAVAMWIKEGKR